MSIFYNRQQRRNISDPEAPKKWYLTTKSTKQLTEDDVAKYLTDETTLNSMEAQMAIRQLEKVLVCWLMEGKTVRLGNIGSFGITVKSRGVDTEDEVHPRIVEKVRLRFRPSKTIKEAIAKMEFMPSEAVSNKK